MLELQHQSVLVISETKYTPADKHQIKKTCFSNLINL